MDANQTRTIFATVRAIANELCEGILPTLAEGHIKVVVVEALLREGFTIREGSHDSSKDKLLTLHSGVLDWNPVPRIKAKPTAGLAGRWHTADVRVEQASKLSILLKAASLHGTGDTLDHKLVRKDVDQVRGGGADVLVIAADRTLYDTLRGEKLDGRGRIPNAPDQFRVLFPASTEIPIDPASEKVEIGSNGSWVARLVKGVRKPERVVLAWWPTRVEMAGLANSPNS